MKRNIILSALAATLMVFSSCTKTNPNFENANWYMGNMTFASEQNGDTIIFRGGNLHEGGMEFCLMPVSKTDSTEEFRLETYGPASQFNITYWNIAKEGARVVLERFDTVKVLNVYDKQGNIIDIAMKYDGRLDSRWEENVIKRIEGSYDSGDQRTFVFFRNRTANIGGTPLNFKIGRSFDTPDQVLNLSDGSNIAFRTSEDSLMLFRSAYISDAGAWDETEPIATLLWNHSSTPSMPQHRWPFISTEIVPTGWLVQFSLAELKQMQHILMHTRNFNKFEELNFALINSVIDKKNKEAK